MSEQLTQQIAEVLRKHAVSIPADGGAMRCSCGGWTAYDDGGVVDHQAEAVVAALELTDTVRLLQAAGTWIAGAVAEDPSGEPWLMTRTLLNELFSRVDALGGWPQGSWAVVLGEEQG